MKYLITYFMYAILLVWTYEDAGIETVQVVAYILIIVELNLIRQNTDKS